jgi:hypothetical protein
MERVVREGAIELLEEDEEEGMLENELEDLEEELTTGQFTGVVTIGVVTPSALSAYVPAELRAMDPLPHA